MSAHHPKLRHHWFILLTLFLLSGCFQPLNDTTLHTLQPIRQQALTPEWKNVGDLILLMPVQLAAHLQRRGLLYQQLPGETRSSTTHLWAGPLDQLVSQQIVAGLKDLLATENVAAFPGPRFGALRYQIEVELNEFSSDDRQFSITAVYTLSDVRTKTIFVRKTFHRTYDHRRFDHTGSVDNASQAVADLSKEIALSLLAAHRQKTTTGSR
ncbi:MAG: membrane integrity-associated transporter subunit PqiC [Desulfobulbus sp.]|nr:membrane integrity-associated transporter subunit PqiC [Desulfobulbus sp.]